jgi:acetyltransferase-like isoleucine patch superfamily enzyme
MNKIWNFLDRIIVKIITFYRKKVFLSKVRNKSKDVRILGKVYVNATNVIIGKRVTLYPGVYFWGDGEIIIGDNVDIGIGTIIFAKKRVIIGDNVNIAANCYIIDSNHGISKNKLISDQALQFDDEGIVIGSDVWIAAGCKIIKGAKINDGAVIGAMSMVNSEIDEYGIALGIPAKVKNFRL